MSALIILVNAASRTLRHTEALLSERGHLVAALSSAAEADSLLDSVTPDLLVTDVSPGAPEELEIAIRSRIDHPDVPVIITSLTADAPIAAEARRHGAAFIEAPLHNPGFLTAVESAIERRRREQPPVRRWFRAAAPTAVEVLAGRASARLIDASYGGVRLAFRSPSEIPPTFELAIPPAGVALRAKRVWTAPADDGDQYWCGAAIVGDIDGIDARWRSFIHSLRDA